MVIWLQWHSSPISRPFEYYPNIRGELNVNQFSYPQFYIDKMKEWCTSHPYKSRGLFHEIVDPLTEPLTFRLLWCLPFFNDPIFRQNVVSPLSSMLTNPTYFPFHAIAHGLVLLTQPMLLVFLFNWHWFPHYKMKNLRRSISTYLIWSIQAFDNNDCASSW